MSSIIDSKVTSSIFNVDPSQAQVWISRNNYENQRPIRSSHVSYLASEIAKGRFIDGTAIHFAELNGDLKLVNGQHTLSAIIKSGCPQRLTVTITKVSSDLEIAQLYFRHDNHLTRQISDAFRALNLDEETGLNLTQQQWVGSAIYVLMSGLGVSGNFRGIKTRISRDDLAKGVVNLAEPAKNYFNCIFGVRPAIHRALTRRASVAVALVTFYYSPVMSVDFWKQVAFTNNVKIGDPRKTLSELLVEVGMIGGGAGKRSASTSYHSRAISVAWNAFFEGRDLKLIKVYEDSPIKILGSPYIGNKLENELQTNKFAESLSFS